MASHRDIPQVTHHRVDADGVRIFYRAAGHNDAPVVVLLLHGFPTSSFQYRELIPRLATRFRVIAPDLPGFGFNEVPPEREYKYTFDSLAKTLLAFVSKLDLKHFAMYGFGYGAPIGFRLALMDPSRVRAIVSQNGNAYEEGLGHAWQPIQRYWREPTLEHRNAIRAGLTLEGMRHEYSAGIPDPSLIKPEGYTPRCRSPGSTRERGDPARPLPRLRQQRKALPQVPGLLPIRAAAALGRVGKV